MSDVSVPPLITAPGYQNLADYPHGWAEREPQRILISRRDDQGRWQDVSAAEFSAEVIRLAKGFVAAGIGVGDRVAMMSRTRYEWTLCDFALWTVGAVSVPIYETSSDDQVRWICQDSGAVAIIVENAELFSRIAQSRHELESVRDVWQIDGGSLDELVVAGTEVDDLTIAQRRAAVQRDDLATVIYTSGTTAETKGCRLSHDNFMALAENAAERLSAIVRAEGASTLLFLPLSHVFARFIQVVVIHAGVRMGHTPDTSHVMPDLATFRPTFVLAVPRVFEKIYNSAEQKAEAAGRGKIFRWAARIAQNYSRALDGRGPSLLLRSQRALADRLVFRIVRGAMGGQVRYAISGGAALGARLGHFFRGAGVLVLEGYGLTESTAPATVNTPDQVRIGTVGRPLPGVSVRISREGEILLKGTSVFSGYHNREEETAAALQDGWLRTGDIGELDELGFLRITGRSKELLVTAAGKNVSPAVLEDRLRAHPLISQCIVVGDGRPYIAALVTLDSEMLPTWAAHNGIAGLTVDQARTHPVVLAEIQAGIDVANAAVSRAESIRRFVILPEDFTIENDLLTPSLKIKRRRIIEHLAAEIDDLYSHPGTER